MLFSLRKLRERSRQRQREHLVAQAEKLSVEIARAQSASAWSGDGGDEVLSERYWEKAQQLEKELSSVRLKLVKLSPKISTTSLYPPY